ncbi:hypothetical protein QJS10_CPA03g01123 [Acorus calamus]|uniref:KIB1-4 beta-propeller domain-containing protein n=1 Tax=Acorus calamus TaxID=4465 RepID=A0AAV9FAW5_ACOCL|nr:hypothetical protein QJS10_CPA03g01123 [Acorus calamus]
MLLLARKTNDDDDNRRDHFLYSPLERKLHPLRLPDRSHPERCLGSSSDGWVCMVDDNLDLYLFNPFFSGAPVVTLPSLRPCFMSVHLPDQDNDDDPEIFYDAEGGIGGGDYIRDVYLDKAIWSAEPTDPHCIVVLLRQHPYNLIYCRPGDAEWTVMGVPILFPCNAVFYKERLCVVSGEGGDIVGFDLLHPRQYIVMPRLENFRFSMTSQMYFVAGPSGLLIIVRDLKHVDEGEMVGFKFEEEELV